MLSILFSDYIMCIFNEAKYISVDEYRKNIDLISKAPVSPGAFTTKDALNY